MNQYRQYQNRPNQVPQNAQVLQSHRSPYPTSQSSQPHPPSQSSLSSANTFNNRLLNRNNNLQNFNVNSRIQHNALINSNPNLQQMARTISTSYSSFDERDKIQNINKQLEKIKSLQEIKNNESFAGLDTIIDKKSLHESIICPIKVVKPAKDNIATSYNQVKPDYTPNSQVINAYWTQRTNEPYKNIIKTEDYKKISLHNAAKSDLLVHKVSNADKLGLMDEFKTLMTNLEKHNTELNLIYTTSKEAEYLSKFQYNNAAKFQIKYDPADFNKLKSDKILEYQIEQEKLETSRKRLEDLIESAITNGTLSSEDISELNIIRNNSVEQNNSPVSSQPSQNSQLTINNQTDTPNSSSNISANISANISSNLSSNITDKYKMRQKRI
jgi:hypothetical protein